MTPPLDLPYWGVQIVKGTKAATTAPNMSCHGLRIYYGTEGSDPKSGKRRLTQVGDGMLV